MATTIQISSELLENLKKKKIYEKESYEEIIWNLIEDSMEIKEETKRDIEKARAEVKAGKVYTHEQAKRILKI